MVQGERLRREPDHGFEERLVLAVLREDWQEVTLQDLGGPQLLPYISSLILVPQVSDQILHTLCRDRIRHLPGTPEEAAQAHALFGPTTRGIHQTSIW